MCVDEAVWCIVPTYYESVGIPLSYDFAIIPTNRNLAGFWDLSLKSQLPSRIRLNPNYGILRHLAVTELWQAGPAAIRLIGRPTHLGGKTTGEVTLNVGKSGQMVFWIRFNLYDQDIAWLPDGHISHSDGMVVRFPQIWMLSGECRL